MEVTPVCISVSVCMHLSVFVKFMVLPLSVVTVVQFCSSSLRLQTTWTTNIGVSQLVLLCQTMPHTSCPQIVRHEQNVKELFLHDASWCANQRCCGQSSPASPSGSRNLYMKMGRQRQWIWYWQETTEVLGRKHVKVSLCTPPMSCGRGLKPGLRSGRVKFIFTVP